MPAYISELYYKGSVPGDFVEVAAPKGTDLSGYSVYIYSGAGSVQAGPLSLGAVQNTMGGLDVYLVDGGTAGFTDIEDSSSHVIFY